MWVILIKKVKHKNRRLIIGTASKLSLAGVPKKHHYKISNISTEASEDNLKQFVLDIIKDNDAAIDVELLKCDNMKYYKMFRVSLCSTFDDLIKDSSKWPEHVQLSRYNFSKNLKDADKSEKNFTV